MTHRVSSCKQIAATWIVARLAYGGASVTLAQTSPFMPEVFTI
jgi:hypothetical protein